MHQDQSTTNVAIKRQIGARNDAPEAMLKDPVSSEPSPWNPAVLPLLVRPDRPQQATTRIPEPHATLAAPIGSICRNFAVSRHDQPAPEDKQPKDPPTTASILRRSVCATRSRSSSGLTISR